MHMLCLSALQWLSPLSAQSFFLFCWWGKQWAEVELTIFFTCCLLLKLNNSQRGCHVAFQFFKPLNCPRHRVHLLQNRRYWKGSNTHIQTVIWLQLSPVLDQAFPTALRVLWYSLQCFQENSSAPSYLNTYKLFGTVSRHPSCMNNHPSWHLTIELKSSGESNLMKSLNAAQSWWYWLLPSWQCLTHPTRQSWKLPS